MFTIFYKVKYLAEELMISSMQGLYKDRRDRHSYGPSTMSTQLVGVFNFPILKFDEGKSATGVAFCD